MMLMVGRMHIRAHYHSMENHFIIVHNFCQPFLVTFSGIFTGYFFAILQKHPPEVQCVLPAGLIYAQLV